MEEKYNENETNNENKDYEIKIEEKLNFISKIIKRLKENKNQKLLTAGNNKVKKTSQSISSLWKLTTFRASLFKQLDKINKIFVKPKKLLTNKYKINIISEATSPKEDEEILKSKETLSEIAPIIPKAISKTVQYNNSEKSQTENNIDK